MRDLFKQARENAPAIISRGSRKARVLRAYAVTSGVLLIVLAFRARNESRTTGRAA